MAPSSRMSWIHSKLDKLKRRQSRIHQSISLQHDEVSRESHACSATVLPTEARKTTFTDLPREIRDDIYTLALVRGNITFVASTNVYVYGPSSTPSTSAGDIRIESGSDEPPSIQLLAMNRQLRAEATTIFLSKNEFHFSSTSYDIHTRDQHSVLACLAFLRHQRTSMVPELRSIDLQVGTDRKAYLWKHIELATWQHLCDEIKISSLQYLTMTFFGSLDPDPEKAFRQYAEIGWPEFEESRLRASAMLEIELAIPTWEVEAVKDVLSSPWMNSLCFIHNLKHLTVKCEMLHVSVTSLLAIVNYLRAHMAEDWAPLDAPQPTYRKMRRGMFTAEIPCFPYVFS